MGTGTPQTPDPPRVGAAGLQTLARAGPGGDARGCGMGVPCPNTGAAAGIAPGEPTAALVNGLFCQHL